MKICSFNVNSIKARKDLVFDWLQHRKNDIDILCLQELKAEDEFFPLLAFKDLGFFCEVFGQKTYNGVAICSKQKPEEVKRGFEDKRWDEQKRLLSSNIKGITLLNLYAPHGGERDTDKYRFKQDWYAHFVVYLSKRFSPQDPLLLVGDFNVAHKDIDVYSPVDLADTIGTMSEERKAFESLLGWGFIDVYRHLYPEQKQFTWWSYMGGAVWKNEGMRIDYVLCTKPLVERFRSIEVDMWPRKRRKPIPSDHAPLIATIDM